MTSYLHFVLSHTIFIPFWIGLFLGSFYTYSGIFYVFGFLVILDIIFGNEKSIIEKSEIISSDAIKFKYLLYSWSIIHLINIIVTLYLINLQKYTFFECIGLILSLGIEGGQSIAVAHELCHKHNKKDKLLARILLFFVLYNHFEIEHKLGHHINVATDKDPATAKYNQTIYNFWVQSVVGSFKSAYNIEKNLCCTIFFNKVILYLIIYSLWLFLLMYINYHILLFFILQSFIAFTFLEISNYFEHYGLQRIKLENGSYESVKFYHSWDNDNCISNWILFRLGRHADHHVHPYKEYQYLKPTENSPQLITGYPGCALLCLIPQLWFYIMNPKVEHIKKIYN